MAESDSNPDFSPFAREPLIYKLNPDGTTFSVVPDPEYADDSLSDPPQPATLLNPQQPHQTHLPPIRT